MALTPYMSLDLPVPTVTIGPAWASMLNAAVQIIDAHDHANGSGKQVPSAGINIDADLDFNNNGLLGSRILAFTDQTSVAETNCFYTDGGELHFVDGAGNDIQITIGGGLNASTIGGIGGDYGLGGSIVNFSNSSNTYFFIDSPNVMASVDVASVFIREPLVANAKYIKLKSPATLAADYELTLLTGLPASTLPLSISNTGVMSTGQILTAQIADLNVTTGKLADLNVTTAKIADDNVTAGKLDPNANVATLVREIITSTQAWARPSGLLGNIIHVRGFGGGGGGAGGSSPSGTSGGGGSGAMAKTISIPLSPSSTSFSVTIGAGGVGGTVGNPGADGGDTIFTDSTAAVELYRWKGGKGGVIGGASGTLAISTYSDLKNITIPGGTGGTSNANGVGTNYIDVFGMNKPFTGGTSTSFPGNGRAGGGGGAGPDGNGGNGGDNNGGATPAGTDGYDAAANSGAGGGGGSSVQFASSHDGGDGGSGKLEVYYWVNVNP